MNTIQTFHNKSISYLNSHCLIEIFDKPFLSQKSAAYSPILNLKGERAILNLKWE
jgi:hypothetical protein